MAHIGRPARINKDVKDGVDKKKTHKRMLLFVGCKAIQLAFTVLVKPTSEMADAPNSRGVNLNVEISLVNEPARIVNDLANFEAATMVVFGRERNVGTRTRGIKACVMPHEQGLTYSRPPIESGAA